MSTYVLVTIIFAFFLNSKKTILPYVSHSVLVHTKVTHVTEIFIDLVFWYKPFDIFYITLFGKPSTHHVFIEYFSAYIQVILRQLTMT